MLEGWVLVQVLIMAIQSVVWRDSWNVIAPAFCDISSHLYQGLTIGIPACSFIITRRVWFAIKGDSALDSHKMRKELLVDYLLGIGAPLLSMIIMYPVQGSRFQVIENYGCSSYIYQCGAALILLQMWTVVFPVLSVSLYGWRIVAYIYRHRRTTNRFLRELTDGSDRPGYIRTVALACVDIALVLPLGLVNIATSVSVGMPFWPGWSTVHQYWAPNTVADTEWRISGVWAANIYWNQCSGVILSAVIFLLFGLTSTTRDLYKKAYKRARLSGSSIAPSWGSSLFTPPSVSLVAVECAFTLPYTYLAMR
ncbi:hypothetical protein PENSPDRAFT_586173 [Peniophora sp. CONT]|nr:hypothetical protein PENSPDRAFT_586173 [Peniophora sp. CONT]